MREFFLIRHAESMGNIGLDAGFDPDLSPNGKVQAAQCAEFMTKFCDAHTIMLSSPFERCLQTAEKIAEVNQLTFRIDVMLHEYFAADWYPLRKVRFDSLKKKAERYPHIEGEYDEGRWWPDRSEEYADVSVRLSMFRNMICGSLFTEEKIICIGHWASIAALARAMIPGIDMDYVENAAVTKIDYIEGKYILRIKNGLCLQD